MSTNQKIILNEHLGVDIGSNTSRLYTRERGLVWQDDSLLVCDRSNSSELASSGLLLGAEAAQALALDPQSWWAIHPVKDGQLTDLPLGFYMIEQYLQQTACSFGAKRASAWKGHVIFSVPFGQQPLPHISDRADNTDKTNKTNRGNTLAPELQQLLLKSTSALDIGGVHIIEKAVASALGADLLVHSQRGSLVVDLGGGCTTVATLSAGEVVVVRQLRAAGNEFDECIVRHFRRKHGVFINPNSAKQLKTTIGAAMLLHESENLSAVVYGLDLVSGLTITLQVDSTDIVEAISEPVQKIVQAVRRVLELTPSNLLFDIMASGFMLTGGSAQLRHFDELLQRATGLPVQLAPSPEQATVRGSLLALEEASLLQQTGALLQIA